MVGMLTAILIGPLAIAPGALADPAPPALGGESLTVGIVTRDGVPVPGAVISTQVWPDEKYLRNSSKARSSRCSSYQA